MPIRWYGPADPSDPTFRHFDRVVNQGKVYAQPFSEGGAAAAGVILAARKELDRDAVELGPGPLALGVGLLELLSSVIPGSEFFRDPSIDFGVPKL